MDETPRSAIVGVLLQVLACGLGIVAFTILPGYRQYRHFSGHRHCQSHATDVAGWLTQECRPGDHRAMAAAAIVGLAAVLLYWFGRNLAKRAGID
jgi:hypothetical protein